MQPLFPRYLPDGDGPALCRRLCARLRPGGAGFPRGSADGVALCRRFCHSVARGLPAIVRRPRAAKEPPR